MEFWLCNEDLNSTRFIRNIADICYHGSYLEAGGEIVTIGYTESATHEDVILYQTNNPQHSCVFAFYLDQNLIGHHNILISCKLSFTTLGKRNLTRTNNYHHSLIISNEIEIFYESLEPPVSDNWYQEGF